MGNDSKFPFVGLLISLLSIIVIIIVLAPAWIPLLIIIGILAILWIIMAGTGHLRDD